MLPPSPIFRKLNGVFTKTKKVDLFAGLTRAPSSRSLEFS